MSSGGGNLGGRETTQSAAAHGAPYGGPRARQIHGGDALAEQFGGLNVTPRRVMELIQEEKDQEDREAAAPAVAAAAAAEAVRAAEEVAAKRRQDMQTVAELHRNAVSTRERSPLAASPPSDVTSSTMHGGSPADVVAAAEANYREEQAARDAAAQRQRLRMERRRQNRIDQPVHAGTAAAGPRSPDGIWSSPDLMLHVSFK